MMVCRCFVVATVKLLAAVDRRKATKMTLGETEEAEGGTVLESQVAMAQAKRNQKRKNKKAGGARGHNGCRTDNELKLVLPASRREH